MLTLKIAYKMKRFKFFPKHRKLVFQQVQEILFGKLLFPIIIKNYFDLGNGKFGFFGQV